ncbi:hypothetical protein MCOR25_003898 [Pyricularia grisea]|uniref:Rhodopsin domain-containing protein n=1 Tax=Pyricularia grisea TaxID=148305 RepID=A0A6P8B8F2_PYRGI|nr:uncharacterized protein PgNI_03584 [Pyricularia grisea]KAI6371870.1 hypothetical protein MCOR25_003898 [Pyricularia grisea]TLD12134.1 hypothetical protein PgNI_03584 [Pyricularia grisea]
MSTVESEEWLAEDKGTAILVTCWIATSISSLFVLSRVYVNGFMKQKLRSDDWFIIIGQFCGYLAVAFATVAVINGNGRHMAALTEKQQSGAILWTTVGFVPGLLSFGLPKLAVVSLLTRLLNPKRFHKWFLWWLGLWCLASVIVTGILLLARCNPAQSLWDFSIKGTCFDVMYLVDFGLYAGSFSAFVDVYLAVYPAVVLFNLQLSLKKKLALSSALGIGSVSGIVAIYKTTRVPTIASADFSYDTSDLVVWTIIEGSTIIIAASIPVLQPLLEVILKRNPFSSNNRSKRDNPSSGYNNLSGSRGYRFEMSDRSRQQSKKQRDELGFTVVDDANSQEEILSPRDKPTTTTTMSYVAGASPAPPSRGNDPEGKDAGGGVVANGGIMRTDVVDVSYHSR